MHDQTREDHQHYNDRYLLYKIIEQNDFIISKLNTMQTDVASLQALVAQETTLEGSIVKLLTALFGQIQTGIDAGDLSAIQATNTQLGQNIANLTAAITANTPVATPPADGGTPPVETPPVDTPPAV